MCSELKCPDCGTNFVAERPKKGKRIRCPECNSNHPSTVEIQADDERPSRRPGERLRCPACEKVMPPGVTRCNKCGMQLFRTRDSVERARDASKSRDNTQDHVDLAGKTLLFCLYVLTFRWGRAIQLLLGH